jgi:hypothetical protein
VVSTYRETTMDFDVYVAARRGRLVERAMELGCPDDLAAEQVDRVLDAQRRRIEKVQDPDPLVEVALESAIAGQPATRGWRRPVAITALAASALAVALVLTYEPPTKAVPSLFGYDGTAVAGVRTRRPGARQLASDRGARQAGCTSHRVHRCPVRLLLCG